MKDRLNQNGYNAEEAYFQKQNEELIRKMKEKKEKSSESKSGGQHPEPKKPPLDSKKQ